MNGKQQVEAIAEANAHLNNVGLPTYDELACLASSALDLLEALETIMRMEVKGHQLQDRLQFSDKGRTILNKARAALAKAKGEA